MAGGLWEPHGFIHPTPPNSPNAPLPFVWRLSSPSEHWSFLICRVVAGPRIMGDSDDEDDLWAGLGDDSDNSKISVSANLLEVC